MTSIAVLGAGKIGEALLTGLVKAGQAGEQLFFTESHADRAAEISERLGIRRVSVAEATAAAELLVVAVKPQDIEQVLVDLAPGIRPGVLVLSLCAGLPTELFERRLGDVAVVRAMPNTPMVVGEAMTAISPGRHAGERELDEAEQVLTTVGRVVRVPENQQDAVTALSGSGPAYFFFLVEAMIEAGVALGVTRALATELIVQTSVGAARMLRESGEHPVVLREAVTSPGGTTAMALRELERHGMRLALSEAIEAAWNRSKELGRDNAV